MALSGVALSFFQEESHQSLYFLLVGFLKDVWFGFHVFLPEILGGFSCLRRLDIATGWTGVSLPTPAPKRKDSC